MKIKRIEFENFRNFKDHGEILCSIDGKVTIIYGRNGDGKTTLHQLLNWIFYDEVHFNKTATSKLYNLTYERNLDIGVTFEVMGRIEFEHDNTDYQITRRYTYFKGISDSELKHRELTLLWKDEDKNWKSVDEKPEDFIEKLLPAALAEYFFFDGESMIADLRVKERESATRLKKALFSMFDLDALDSAIAHIGETSKKTTVLGKLYLDKIPTSSSTAANAVKANIENAQVKLVKLNENLDKKLAKRKEREEYIKSISEAIGNQKSKADYENERKTLQSNRDLFIKNSNNAKSAFGDIVSDTFPQILISKAVENAKDNIHLEIAKNKLPHGISKTLINYLISDKTTHCICGKELTSEEKQHIENYLKLLPPNSYTELYNQFSAKAKMWGNEFDKNKLDEFIRSVLDNDAHAHSCDVKIMELDEVAKNSPDIEDLIISRQQAEQDVSVLNKEIVNFESEIKNGNRYLKKQMSDFDKLTEDNKTNEDVNRKILIMENVKQYFMTKKEEATIEYSGLLKKNIQALLDKMLTSKRSVFVSPEFSVRVTDSGGDESKSEGQFAVVSFAYIGGILKMLRNEASLSAKEYPLVLDGPFSKLDPIQRQNVVNALPEFAPQVIIFSKDELQNVFDEKNIGRVWTIESNEEKNIAKIKEGYLWK